MLPGQCPTLGEALGCLRPLGTSMMSVTWILGDFRPSAGLFPEPRAELGRVVGGKAQVISHFLDQFQPKATSMTTCMCTSLWSCQALVSTVLQSPPHGHPESSGGVCSGLLPCISTKTGPVLFKVTGHDHASRPW